jgi:tRNA(fMet)-specific endonuclease VapC
VERLILDTTVLIAAERANGSMDEVIGDDDDVAMAAVTVAELLVGVELADRAHQPARRRYVDALVDTIPIERYDLEVARTHAALLAHTYAEGRPRGSHDLLIAATARKSGRTVVTADLEGFADLPQVQVRVLPPRGRAAAP